MISLICVILKGEKKELIETVGSLVVAAGVRWRMKEMSESSHKVQTSSFRINKFLEWHNKLTIANNTVLYT